MLGGFFLKPEVAVLGVTWTLVVQVLFYLYCVAARPLLRTIPIAVPIARRGAVRAVLLYNLYVPQPYAVPMLSKVAATLPAVFIGQIIYLGWARLANWRWVSWRRSRRSRWCGWPPTSACTGPGDRYLWTIVVVTARGAGAGPVRRVRGATGRSCAGSRPAATRSTCCTR